jgi:mono/diheme cytochrome c family protein
MQDVTNNLADAPEGDAKAIAGYVERVLVPATAGRRQHADELLARIKSDDGAAAAAPSGTVGAAPGAASNDEASVYAGACAICHEPSGQGFSAHGIPLSLSKVVALPDPSNLIHLILEGIEPPVGAPFAFMPGFDGALTDEQIARLAEFLRRTYSDQPAWKDIAKHVRKVREQAAKQARAEAEIGGAQ